jgi:stage V sporulation protein B
MILGAFLAITNGILQSYGKAKLTIIGVAIGGAVKLLMNYFLIPVIGIDAAPIATSTSYIFTVGLNIYFVYRASKPELGLFDFILKPCAAAVGMGVAAWYSYAAILPFIASKAGETWGIKISCAIAICIAALVYGILLFVVRAIKREDVEMLPKGDKIAGLLQKFKLI